MLVHEMGKCAIKSGDYLEMLEISASLTNLDLKTSVEEYASNMH